MTTLAKICFYENKLNSINNIHFTHREMDIIACLVNLDDNQKISSLLSIATKTVNVNIRNIMIKLGIKSRGQILDLIMKSGKVMIIKDYYHHIELQALFEKKLSEIEQEITTKTLFIQIVHQKLQPREKQLLKLLKHHLSLANITLQDSASPSQKPVIRILDKQSKAPKHTNKNIYLSLDETIHTPPCLNLATDYYLSVFALIERLINNAEIIILKRIYEKEHEIFLKQNSKKNLVSSTIKSYIKFTPKISILLLGVICALFYFFYFSPINIELQNNEQIKSGLSIPNKSILLNRSTILKKITKKLDGDSEIKKIALIGVGGSGKTTLARQYADQSDSSVVWEINSETQESLLASIHQLAYSLCSTTSEQEELNNILNIQNTYDPQGKFVLFLTKQLKQTPGWLIIYDNVDDFQTIQEYFPHSEKAWGVGKVIITTRDSNIVNNYYIPYNQTIHIPELNQEEKSNLFNNILDKKQPTKEDDKTLAKIVNEIPPFPLDISVAAHYLKGAHMSYQQFLDHLLPKNDKFNNLDEIDEYQKSRYDIVTLAAQNLIEKKYGFKELLLFISLLDSQNIPRQLLSKYKNNIIVDQFIHDLKGFSLVIEQNTDFEHRKMSSLSIHRISQKIILSYLLSILDKSEKEQFIGRISDIIQKSLKNALKEYDIPKLKTLSKHAESFLNYVKHENKLVFAISARVLGDCYIYTGEYKKSEKLLNESLSIFQDNFEENNFNIITTMVKLGTLYTRIGDYQLAIKYFELSREKLPNTNNYAIKNLEQQILLNLAYAYRDLGNIKKATKLLEQALSEFNPPSKKTVTLAIILQELGYLAKASGDYKKSESLLEQSLNIYKNYYDDDNIRIAWNITHFGNLYRNTGKYIKSQKVLERSYQIYKHNYGINNVKSVWVLVALGNLHRSVGMHNKAKPLLELAHKIYKKNYGNNHIRSAWTNGYLGILYHRLGDYHSSKELLEQSLKVHERHFGPNHIRSYWAKFNLAKTYAKLHRIKQAKKLLEESLINYQKFYGDIHQKPAQILLALGRINLINNNLDAAEEQFIQSLDIYNMLNHTDTYMSMEALGDLHMLRANKELPTSDLFYSHINSASNYFKQSLDITKAFLPQKSLYTRIIRKKLHESLTIQHKSHPAEFY